MAEVPLRAGGAMSDRRLRMSVGWGPHTLYETGLDVMGAAASRTKS